MNSAVGGGEGGIELSSSVASAIAGSHDQASGRIIGLSGSVPNLDAGYGGQALADILAKVLGTADTLAMINEAAADQVRVVANHFQGTDAEVAGWFAELSGDPWPFGEEGSTSPPANPFLLPSAGGTP
jgi:uncharacterized protein YukE